MTLSTTGAPSNGLVYLTMTGTDSSGHTITEQGSGVLLSDDEVLTAAHLVYNSNGSLRTAGTAAVGYSAGTSIGTSKIDGVQVGAEQDYTSVAGMSSDFAVVHLSTKITNGTIFSLGSDLATGTFDVSGYPVGTAGSLDTKSEALSLASGTNIYTGSTLHDGTGNPNGSSGGSIYQVVNGAPTAYGVISADLTSDTTQGFFKELTATDVAQIRSWVAAADTIGATPLANTAVAPVIASAPLTGVGTTSAAIVAPSTPGFSADMAVMLNTDADSYSGQKHVMMTDVAAAIASACQQGGTFAQLTQDAQSYLDNNSSVAKRAVAYLAGLLSGTTGTWSNSLQSSADKMIAGAVTGVAMRSAAASGRSEGLGMGTSNTSALISPSAATLASVIADGGARADTSHTFSAAYTQPTISFSASHFIHH